MTYRSQSKEPTITYKLAPHFLITVPEVTFNVTTVSTGIAPLACCAKVLSMLKELKEFRSFCFQVYYGKDQLSRNRLNFSDLLSRNLLYNLQHLRGIPNTRSSMENNQIIIIINGNTSNLTERHFRCWPIRHIRNPYKTFTKLEKLW